jgi:hypothetical protein
MSALTNEQRRELEHIAIVTDRGSWTYRYGARLMTSLADAGYIEMGSQEYNENGKALYRVCRITPAGIAALADGEPSTVRAYCETCKTVTVHHCLYDHASGERFACAGCANVEEPAS